MFFALFFCKDIVYSEIITNFALTKNENNLILLTF
jgi:hypothetical protein